MHSFMFCTLKKHELSPVLDIKVQAAANSESVSRDNVSCSINYIPPIDALTFARESQTSGGQKGRCLYRVGRR